ncbi:hypothetical protein [Providencia rettgeri]|uniref:hypothetical protein n=1 Tax=Providencia rettgeri TaxID=587 RepID=UPI001BA6AE3E|nr:hypothetical protein [Providencia rettgeri]MBS0917189.1 hypothetical protein [Providencia rettgeri]
MSDKKEIATLSIKISVDSTDLDKLEAQLKRIEGLMVSTGLKQPAQQGFTMDFGIFNPKGCLEPVFTVSSSRVFINDVFIDNGTIEKMALQPAEEQTKKGVEQVRFEITTGVNDSREQQSAVAILESSAEIAETSKAISREQSEFEKFKQKVESEFSQLHSSITAIQHTQANSEIASSNAIEQVRAEIQRKEPLDL